MKFRSLEVTFNSRKQAAEAVEDYVRNSVEVRHVIARMARSEVKNCLAEVAEVAGVPYIAPGFLGPIGDPPYHDSEAHGPCPYRSDGQPCGYRHAA